MADYVNSWSVCVMALAPFPPLFQPATSLPCCCCCWMPDRLEDMFIRWNKKRYTWDPVHYRLALTALPPSRFHWRTALFTTLHSPLERGMFWESWVWLYSQKMRSVVCLSRLYHVRPVKTAGMQCREQMDSVSVVERFCQVNTSKILSSTAKLAMLFNIKLQFFGFLIKLWVSE